MPHTDYSRGFGGKFGVQRDRQDKSAAGWDHIEKVEKHDSQRGAKGLLIMIQQGLIICLFPVFD